LRIDRLDHLVLTVASIDASCAFYQRVLGMTIVGFGQGRTALSFGNQKINLHQAGREFVPHAHRPVPGSATEVDTDPGHGVSSAAGRSSRVRSIAPGR
jgi:catechol 2,3-dioxygenase-like lactoylglutathione lyase family enzyme